MINALKKLFSRKALGLKAAAYESAGYGRRLQRWSTTTGSMNHVLLSNLETLQTRLGSELFKQIILSDSLHAYYTEHEQDIIKQAMLQFL